MTDRDTMLDHDDAYLCDACGFPIELCVPPHRCRACKGGFCDDCESPADHDCEDRRDHDE